MHLTHLGHSTLLIDVAGYRVLIDPGTFTDHWETLTDLSAVLVTHAHPDHFDIDRFPTLLDHNPDIIVGCEAELAAAAAAPFVTHTLTDGLELPLGPLTATIHGGRHANIHPDMPDIGNVGILLTGPDGHTVYHPGDALDRPVTGVDLLAAPLNGPWCSIADIVAYVRTCAPRAVTPIHDGLLSATGRGLYTMLLNKLSGEKIQLRDCAGGDRHPVRVD